MTYMDRVDALIAALRALQSDQFADVAVRMPDDVEPLLDALAWGSTFTREIIKGIVQMTIKRAVNGMIADGTLNACTECGGSGEVGMFNGDEPCSKGCKKP